MPDPVEIRAGDIVRVRRVELYYAVVERAGPRDLAIRPLDPRIRDSRVRIEEVERVFRDIGSPAPPPARLRPSPRQLRFDDVDEPR